MRRRLSNLVDALAARWPWMHQTRGALRILPREILVLRKLVSPEDAEITYKSLAAKYATRRDVTIWCLTKEQ